MSEMNPADILDLEITGLAPGGKGLARAPDGRVVFVLGALPQERVRARVQTVRSHYLEAEATEVLQACTQRVQPRCSLYHACGGCDLMHLEYGAQVLAKAQWVEQALSRLEDTPRAHTIGSEECWGWRNRVRFQVIGDQLGFFARGSHELVVVDHCPIAAPGVNQVLNLLLDRLKKAPIPNPAWIEVLAGPDGPAFITLGFDHQTGPPPEAVSDWQQWAKEHDLGGVRFVSGSRNRRWQPSRENGLVYFQKAGLKMRAYPGIFCQANFSTNQSLINTILESANGRGRALELYAGSGNFSLPLAQAGWQVLALEGQAQAVQACRFQAQVNKLTDSLEVRNQAVGPGLKRLVQDQQAFDLVVLDPPRAGAKGLMPQIAALNPRRVIYVSCHPAALARDAAHLIRVGYGFNSLTIVDMFPHTAQVESVLVLDREQADE